MYAICAVGTPVCAASAAQRVAGAHDVGAERPRGAGRRRVAGADRRRGAGAGCRAPAGVIPAARSAAWPSATDGILIGVPRTTLAFSPSPL